MPRLALATLLALLALPSAAQAAFFPPEVVDASPDLIEVGDVDITRDGTGLLGYLKRDGGTTHAFISRFVDGIFQPPERVDAGLSPESDQIVVAAGEFGRQAIAYVNDGKLWTHVRPKDAQGFAAPTVVAEGGGVSNPAIDISVNGAIYLSWTHNGDIRVARANRDDPQFVTLPNPVDVDTSRDAGSGPTKRSRIVVSADGTALVVWGEDGADGRTHVYARRIFELRPSDAPQDLTLNDLDGVAARGADTPEVDIEDDSSYAQVTFRQNTANGPRVVMRRLLGSQFDPHLLADSGGFAQRARIDLNGRGEGLVATSMAGNEVFAGTIFNNRFNTFNRLDTGNGIDPLAVAAIGENEDGVVAWLQGPSANDASVKARYINNIERPEVEPEATLSSAPVDTKAGLDAASSRAGDAAIVFIQGTGGERRLIAAVYDKPPLRNAGQNTQKIRRLTRLRWSTSLNLFGPVTYRVLVDGRAIGETRQQEMVPAPGAIRDGEHRWQVVAIDRRGQETVSRTRLLRIDNTAPTLRIGVRRKGRVVTVTAKAGDNRGSLRTGVRRMFVDWGDGGGLRRLGRKASKRYGRLGRYTLRVKAVDRAGNDAVQSRRLRIGV